MLQAASVYVGICFLANLFETVFWCYPQHSMWTPKTDSDLCKIKLDSSFNSTQFVAHITSTIVVIVLPAVLLGQVEMRRRELAFAFSTFGFGIVSIAASAASYIMVMRISKNPLDPNARHATLVGAIGDQNTIFLAACVSVMKISRKPRDATGEDSSGTKGLVIKVERRYSVRVEIVEKWGYGWRDPWEAEMETSRVGFHAGTGSGSRPSAATRIG